MTATYDALYSSYEYLAGSPPDSECDSTLLGLATWLDAELGASGQSIQDELVFLARVLLEARAELITEERWPPPGPPVEAGG